jgi:Uma2 family endonuclease
MASIRGEPGNSSLAVARVNAAGYNTAMRTRPESQSGARGGCELIDGEVVDMTPAGGQHGSVQVNLAILVGGFVKEKRLGNVSVGETGYLIRTDPDTVRAPDLGFVRKSRIPPTGVPKRFWPLAPDLAVEVVSPGDSYENVETKVHDWLEAGTIEVWVANPRLLEIKVYRSKQPVQVHRMDEEIRSEDLLPGFSTKVREIFDI